MATRPGTPEASVGSERARRCPEDPREQGEPGLNIAAAIKAMTREELDVLLDSAEGGAEQIREGREFLASPEAQAVLGKDDEPNTASLAAFARELATAPVEQRRTLIERHLDAPLGLAPVGRLQHDKAAVVRALELWELPRIRVSPIETRERLVRRVEDIALELGEWRAEREVAGDPNWRRVADLLDEVMDVLEAVKGPLGTVEIERESLADLLSRITPENCHTPDDFGSEEERRFLEERDNVSDDERVARMNSTPDVGGALLAKPMADGEPTYEEHAPESDAQAATRIASELIETAVAFEGHGLLSASDVARVKGLLSGSIVPVCLLFRDEQTVQWSLNRIELERAMASVLADGGNFAHNAVLELDVSVELAQQLTKLRCPDTVPPLILDEDGLTELARYRDKECAYLATRPEWLTKEGLRVYVTFLASGACRWSPSGNNIDGIISRAPSGTFLCNAQRLELTEDQYVDLTAFFKWSCDNF